MRSSWLVTLLAFGWCGALTTKNKDCPFLDGIYISVMRRIFNQGFHKELFIEVELMWTTSILPDECQLVVEETMPRGMYVDPDQLWDLRKMTGLKTHVAAEVDVEKPEYESKAFRVLIFRPLATQENLRLTSVKLPVHVRYHKPDLSPDGSSGPEAVVKLQNPRLLLSCEGENVASRCPERTVTSYCDTSGNTKCEYLHLPYKINVNSVEISVPVGNVDHTWHVVGLTTFVVSGGTIYLLVSLFRKLEPVA